ncbi:hypothetical protein AAH979_26790 [Plantactinospora sp. ZYX-F-223]|uniref:hypothetical protein n=1 Tax=Plantactinospora sp. ZYX-F-223 TaxID=3144103 RepID=UPI0031FC1C68
MRNLARAALAALLLAVPPATTAAADTTPVAAADVPLAGTTLHYTNNVGYSSGPKGVGFNLWDLGPYPEDVAALPAGHRALVWVGGDNSTCTSEYTDSEFNALVDDLAGSDKVFGWYLWDEPDLDACPTLIDLLKRRAAAIRSRTGGRQLSFVASGGGDGEAAPPELAPARSGVDLIGLDPYPCRIGEACEYSLIDQAVRQTIANGTPASAIVPVFQAFGQTCASIPADHRKWRMPTGAELDQIFARWDSLVPSPVFDDAYSWGTQPEWSCPSLSSNPTIQNRFKTRFAAAAGTAGPRTTLAAGQALTPVADTYLTGGHVQDVYDRAARISVGSGVHGHCCRPPAGPPAPAG